MIGCEFQVQATELCSNNGKTEKEVANFVEIVY